MAEKIEIKSTGTGGSIYIDGTDISHMCVTVDIKLQAGDPPKISIECAPMGTMLYMVEHETCHFDELITAATAILRTELMKHGDLYNGYLASIGSSLRENIVYEPDIEHMSGYILKRIIGEE